MLCCCTEVGSQVKVQHLDTIAADSEHADAEFSGIAYREDIGDSPAAGATRHRQEALANGERGGAAGTRGGRSDADRAHFEGKGVTPLIEKCYRGDMHAVELLLQAGASINAAALLTLATPLHAACAGGDPGVVQRLLEGRADVGASMQGGLRPLHSAIQGGSSDSAQVLLKAKASIEATAQDGCKALHMASKIGLDEVLQVLLMAGASTEAVDNGKWRPLHWAASTGHAHAVQILLRARASVGAATDKGACPLHLAAERGNVEAVRALLGAGAVTIEATTDKKGRPLHRASENGHVKVVQALLLARAAVNATEKDGYTSLHLASFFARGMVAETVQALLEAEADVNVRGSKEAGGESAIELAKGKGHIEIVELLRKAAKQ